MIASLAFALAVAASTPPETVAERERLMTSIEARIVMPPGAGPPASYERLYAADLVSVDIVALYRRSDRAGRRWLDDIGDIPIISDGGCAFIDVRISHDPAVPIRATCHGEA